MVLLGVGVAAGARADEPLGPQQRLARGEVCLAALDFECAEAELAEARKGHEKLSPGERRQVFRLSAETALSLEKRAHARSYLTSLLELSPGFMPRPGAWPKPWLVVLEEARGARPDRDPPQLRVALPMTTPAGKEVVIEVEAIDRSGVGGVTAFSKTGSGVQRLVLGTTDGRLWRATLPADRVVGPVLQLWIEATDSKGNGPARWGSAAEPQRIVVVAGETHEEAPSLVTRWWFWTAIGGAVAAATAVTVYLVTREDEAGVVAPAVPTTGGVQVRFQLP